MFSLKKQIKTNLLSIVWLLIILLVIFVIYQVLRKLDDDIIKESKIETQLTVKTLCKKAEIVLKSIDNEYLFSENITNKELNQIDSILKPLSKESLEHHKNFKGGFYLVKADRFAGYAFPDSKPPFPAYGPAPRSHSVIRTQALLSLQEEKTIVKLHKFEPNVFFPLATKPVFSNGEIVLIAWARTHILEQLPTTKLKKAGTYIASILLTILIILVYFSVKTRADIKKINEQLNSIQSQPNFRLKSSRGLFSNIINSVNYMLETLQKGNFKQNELEKRLLQKEKMASIGRIVAGVAHEVRTPLAIIKTRIQMWQYHLKEKKQSENCPSFITEEAMTLVVDETDRLSDLIKRFLTFSKPINKKMTQTSIPELLKEIITLLEIKKENFNINFIFNNINIPTIEIDRNSIYQVFLNVLSNSMEAMPNGGDINIDINTNNNDFKIEITDSGIGIPDKIFDKIFELFVTSKPSGVGLGLPISYEIIKAHNGSIHFEKQKEEGTKCTILLPLGIVK